MNRKDYSAGAVKHTFWFMEFRKVVSLRLEGKTWEEIKQLNENENIFGAPTKLRATQIFNTVSARVKSLDDSFYSIFDACDLASQKLFALVAAMTYDVLFGDLVYELVREKMIIGSNELSDSDLRIFFKDKQQQNDKVAKWTEATIKKLMVTYKSMLFEAGVTNKAKDIREIYKPLPDPAMEGWMKEQRMMYQLKAIMGVRSWQDWRKDLIRWNLPSVSRLSGKIVDGQTKLISGYLITIRKKNWKYGNVLNT